MDKAPHRSARFVAILVAALMLGQGFSASAVPCAMPDGDHESHAGMDHSMPEGMDHSAHDMQSTGNPEPGDTSAVGCAGGGPGSMSACLAVPALTASMAAEVPPRVFSHAIWHSPPSPETATELFYRPPIAG